jgi:hypothetical protein
MMSEAADAHTPETRSSLRVWVDALTDAYLMEHSNSALVGLRANSVFAWLKLPMNHPSESIPLKMEINEDLAYIGSASALNALLGPSGPELIKIRLLDHGESETYIEEALEFIDSPTMKMPVSYGPDRLLSPLPEHLRASLRNAVEPEISRYASSLRSLGDWLRVTTRSNAILYAMYEVLVPKDAILAVRPAQGFKAI